MATWLAGRVGHDTVLEVARAMGVRTALVDHKTLAMGTQEMSLMDNALGYATVARGGVPVTPVLVRSVVDWHGQTVDLPVPPVPWRALSTEVAAELDQALREVVRSGTARAAWHPQRVRAGKTGTTDGPSDAWFIGYTPQHTVAVWIGSDQRVPLGPDATGASLALPVWLEIVEALEAGLP
jgi:penicillin-binding protein 1A